MLEFNDFTESLDFGHGRIETRKCAVITDLSLIEKPTAWKSLTSIVRIESERHIKSTGVTQTRYYISSLCADANQLLHAIRSHWAIENNVHWSLDVAFNEDSSRKRSRNAATNFSIISRLALNMIKKEDSKMGLKAKRLLAGWSQDYILKVLNF